ncbi:nipped-B-like protein B isoform X2 [Nematostella vectensis]|uniref:nipped-B-like protein B isoform X2 n=1 Tax=Nematostella vectensis TaxID=45351 RepID=UPI0020776A42|nr:nipped-B-like protein B isoform X2 [Nematostella vectensis]
MNEPNVPIATLSGITSLTNLLPQLPLPSPVSSSSNRSLLDSPKEADEAVKVLNDSRIDSSLLHKLAQGLKNAKANQDQLILKDEFEKVPELLSSSDGPILLQKLLQLYPNVFKHDKDSTQDIIDEFLGGITAPLSHPPIVSPQMSPHQVGITVHDSPMYAGSPPNLGHSTYNQAMHGSPVPFVGSPQRNIPLGYGQVQALSPNIPKRQGPFGSPSTNSGYMSPTLENIHAQTFSPVKTRRMRQSLSDTSPNCDPSLQPNQVSPDTTRTFNLSMESSHQMFATGPTSRKKPSRSKHSPVEMIDLNNQYGISPPVVDCQENIPIQTSNVPSPIEMAPIKPARRRSKSSTRKSMEDSLQANNHEWTSDQHDLNQTECLTIENAQGFSENNTHKVPDMIDLNKSLEGLDSKCSNVSTSPLKKLQLCIPKLVITKVKERRGSKEFETHSVRAVIPAGEDSESTKKKRHHSLNDSNSDIEAPTKKKRKTKEKRKLEGESGDIESLLESVTFRRFATALENLFEFDDECGVAYMADVDDEEPASESLATRTEISELYTESAKLKSLGVIHQIATDQLFRLLSIMERHVRDGMLLKLSNDQEEEDEQKLWRDLCLDRIIRSVESSLVVLNILTSPNIPKQLYLEEVMDRIIRLIKFHLQNNIFPEYDPVYRDPDAKDNSIFVPKSKRSKACAPKMKMLTVFYNKVCELISQLGDLVDVQALTDTTILQVSTLGVSPFFVENISDLQHSSMKLVRSVFRRYVKHRDLILEDIFASLARLPSSKRNIRSYRLNDEESIQMVTALVLQLIQCSVKIPEKEEVEENAANDGQVQETSVQNYKDIMICNSYENALRTAQNFISMFLNKCSSVGKDEEDYRPLFENFLQDLLLTLNKPEWPAAEVLLTLLGKLLIVTFNNKSVDVSLRVSAIDYLGVVAAHLRKDAVVSQKESENITDLMIDLLGDTSDESEEEYTKWDERSAKRMQVFQKGLANYLTVEGQNDPALLFAKKFYIAQWVRDTQVDIERLMRAPTDLPSDGPDLNSSFMTGIESLQKLEEEKKLLHDLLDDRLTDIRSSHNQISLEKALLMSRYLGSSRSFSRSFDNYLGQILRILNENVVAIRTKAMKALSAVVCADPSILSREDMQNGVHNRLVDMSTSVREAAVELIGRFVLNKPELIHQYYDMIIERILDTGISVRKRVIKILRDICINQPDFPKVTEICVKIIRRISDEEGIKELVTKVFHQMWFTPEKTADEAYLKRVVQMTEVVSACGENTDWFEQLLENLLKSDEDAIVKSSEKACQQIVSCLVENVLRQEEKLAATPEGRGSSSQKLIASLSALYLIAKIKPQLLVNHGTILQPYLSTKCNTQGDFLVIHNVARILELVVPLMDHPSESFLASLEEDLMRLTVKHGQTVVQSCVSCLGAVVNRVTHNYKLVKDYFQKYYGFLVKTKLEHSKNGASNGQLQTQKPTLLRSLFTLGLLCKHFDFETSMEPKNQMTTRNKVFAVYIYFSKHNDEEVCQKAISGLGFFCMRYAELLLKDDAKHLYQEILSSSNTSVKLKWQVLKNFQTHLLEEERRLRILDHEWKKQSDKENLKELGDSQSGQTSAVMQVYLKNILDMFFHKQGQLRTAALTVINLILRQGLVHPVQCVPYLIAAGTDTEPQTCLKADQQITDINNKYSGFVQMKALAGTKMSFDLQQLIHQSLGEPIRGFRQGTTTSLLSHMYSVVRTSRQPRRSLLQALLRMFDDPKQKSKLDLLLYVADNLAYFPYAIQEEPLFLMHKIDTMLSVAGANVLQSFKEVMLPLQRKEDDAEPSNSVLEEEEDETVQSVSARIPPDTTAFQDHCVALQSCLLLLLLKEHLKELFGLSDSKCHKYSPSAPSKAYDKTVTRKPGIVFNPEQVVEYVTNPKRERTNDELAHQYCEFKNMMMQLDPPDDDSEDSGRDSPAVDAQPITDAEGNPIAKAPIPVKPKKKPTKGRKTPPVAKAKPKPRKKRRKITMEDADSDDEVVADPSFKC